VSAPIPEEKISKFGKTILLPDYPDREPQTSGVVNQKRSFCDGLSLSHGIKLDLSRGTTIMKNKPLIETNPHLKVPGNYRETLIATVASSTAIETGASIASIARVLAKTRKTWSIKKTPGSAR
jgi:hypothetical protein